MPNIVHWVGPRSSPFGIDTSNAERNKARERAIFERGSSRGKQAHPNTDVGSDNGRAGTKKKAAASGSQCQKGFECIFLGIGEDPFANSPFGKVSGPGLLINGGDVEISGLAGNQGKGSGLIFVEPPH